MAVFDPFQGDSVSGQHIRFAGWDHRTEASGVLETPTRRRSNATERRFVGGSFRRGDRLKLRQEWLF
jgi:hypothetical protein